MEALGERGCELGAASAQARRPEGRGDPGLRAVEEVDGWDAGESLSLSEAAI